MTPQEFAESYRVAAQIALDPKLEWEVRANGWTSHSPYLTPMEAIALGYTIRIKPLILLSPPDGRALHNPDNLTADQVGANYRLLLPEEVNSKPMAGVQLWETVCKSPHWVDAPYAALKDATFRVPASTPWPELPKLKYIPPNPPRLAFALPMASRPRNPR